MYVNLLKNKPSSKVKYLPGKIDIYDIKSRVKSKRFKSFLQ